MLYDQGLEIPADLVREDLTVALLPERVRYNLRKKLGDLARVTKASGLELPTKIGNSSVNGECLIFMLGPDEWIVSDTLSNKDTLARLLEKLSRDFIMSATDISHRNIGFSVSGALAEQAINIGCPLDLSLPNFPVGKVTRTIFENAPIQLYRAGANEFHIECWRSFAPYLRDFLQAYVRDI